MIYFLINILFNIDDKIEFVSDIIFERLVFNLKYKNPNIYHEFNEISEILMFVQYCTKIPLYKVSNEIYFDNLIKSKEYLENFIKYKDSNNLDIIRTNEEVYEIILTIYHKMAIDLEYGNFISVFDYIFSNGDIITE